MKRLFLFAAVVIAILNLFEISPNSKPTANLTLSEIVNLQLAYAENGECTYNKTVWVPTKTIRKCDSLPNGGTLCTTETIPGHWLTYTYTGPCRD